VLESLGELQEVADHRYYYAIREARGAVIEVLVMLD